jgi:hypothetical protein
MSRLRVVLSRLRAMAGSHRRDRELEDEIASHLAEAADDLERQGLSPDEARRAAGRRFGNVTRTREVYRETASFTWPADLVRDVRHGMHVLRRAPAYTAAATATLALAIGASTAMISVLDAVLLRPLPYSRPTRWRCCGPRTRRRTSARAGRR